jgi:hypothetical protein
MVSQMWRGVCVTKEMNGHIAFDLTLFNIPYSNKRCHSTEHPDFVDVCRPLYSISAVGARLKALEQVDILHDGVEGLNEEDKGEKKG